MKFLTKSSLGFRDSNKRLYQNSNCNFWGLIGILAKFDPIVEEHVTRITNDNNHIHYLDNNMQNELIFLFVLATKTKIIIKII